MSIIIYIREKSSSSTAVTDGSWAFKILLTFHNIYTLSILRLDSSHGFEYLYVLNYICWESSSSFLLLLGICMVELNVHAMVSSGWLYIPLTLSRSPEGCSTLIGPAAKMAEGWAHYAARHVTLGQWKGIPNMGYTFLLYYYVFSIRPYAIICGCHCIP